MNEAQNLDFLGVDLWARWVAQVEGLKLRIHVLLRFLTSGDMGPFWLGRLI